MRKLTLIAAVAVLATTFASCKKNRTCECVYTGTGQTSGSYTINSTKATGETLCAAYQGSYETCTLKD